MSLLLYAFHFDLMVETLGYLTRILEQRAKSQKLQCHHIVPVSSRGLTK